MSVGAPEQLLIEPEAGAEVVLAGGEIAARTPMQLFWRRFRADPIGLVSGAFIVALVSGASSSR